MSYWELNVCTNQLLIDSFSVSCFTVSAQFLGRWVDQLKIVTDRQIDILAFYISSVNCLNVSAQFLGRWVHQLKIVTDRQTDRRMEILAFGMSSRPCSRSPLGGQLATTLVDRYFHHYFFHLARVVGVAVSRR